MASNGGTLHGVPQPIHQPSPPGGFTCSQCGLLFDSGASLQVHTHYHHEQQQQQQNPRWQSPSSTNSGNNSPPLDHANGVSQEANNNHLKHSTKCISPTATAMNGTGNSNNTIAAADSSDNQPSTPSSMENGTRNNSSAYGNANQEQLNYYQQTAYEQHYQPQYPTTAADYPGSTTANNNLMMQPPHEYKSGTAPPPSSRYHPYSSPVNQQQGNSSSPSTTNLNSASPRLVSSSSPNHHNQHLGQPTPSPSPKQCDKCGLVCSTVSELNEHYVTAHSTNGGDFQGTNSSTYPPFGGAPALVKDEPACDILDLDSQKMVYPPHHNNNDPSLLNNNSSNGEGPLPSMQSLHTIQRHHPVMWQPTGHEMYNMQQQQQRGEYGMMSPTIPQPAQTHLSSSPSSGGVPSIKSEYMGMAGSDIKPFDQSSNITTSPSDFPSTTTPQDSNNNNTSGPFRTSFEPPTSSLPAGITSVKSTAWKSNEARRPKTYNCTACNKWFTSSGHLKRHYNTTLHKNAVKASNQPDPATMPISAHHHPARDPNSKHHRSSNSGQVGNAHPPQSQPPPTDPQRSPDYAPQFAVSSATAGGYTNVAAGAPLHHNQGFQQYSASLHSNAGIPPNGQAGPSVHASLPRGLLNYSNNHHLEVPQVPVLQHHIISSEAHTTASSSSTMPHLLDRDPLSLSPTPGITTTHHLSPSTITTTQQLTPIISTSMEPLLLPPPGYTSSRLATTTITTTSPPLSRLEVIQPPLSYHTIIGSHQSSQEELHQSHQQQQEENTDGMIMNGHQEEQTSRLTLLPPSYTEYSVAASATEMYTIRLLSNPGQEVADTAPYSPNMPHDPYKHQEPLPAMSASDFQHRVAYMQQPMNTTMQLPKLGETAPEICASPAPGSPSVTSSDSVLMEQKPNLGAKAKEQDYGTKKFECVQCDKTFNKSCYLTQHNKTFHSGEKPFKCHRCGKRFSCDQSHEEHVAKHSGDKPFKCELCPKAFNHKTDLRRHMCLHSGRKPFHCDQCGKGFIRKDHLVKHMDVHTRKAEQMKRKLEQQPGEKGSRKVKLEMNYEEEEEEDEDNSMSLMM